MDAFYALDNEFPWMSSGRSGKEGCDGDHPGRLYSFRAGETFDVVRTGRQAEIIKEHTALMNALMKKQSKRSPRDPVICT